MRGGILPIALHGRPTATATIGIIRFAVLDNESGDALRRSCCQPETDLCTVIMNIERVPLKAERMCEDLDRVGVVLEGVGITRAIRAGAEAECRKIRGDD